MMNNPERNDAMPLIQRITPCLWFDDQAEPAANFYVSVFDNSRITAVSHYGKAGQEVHGRPAGSVLAVSFELDGHTFSALNGGPVFKLNEAVSFQVNCDTQAEVDRYWGALGEGGDAKAHQCGWLKDKFGASWQIVPRILIERLGDPDPLKTARVMTAMLQMKKIDIDAIERAYRP